MSTPYCTLAEAQNLIPTITISASGTIITTAIAGALLTAVSSEIDQHLNAAGYGLPVTDVTDLASLKSTCMFGTAAAILKAQFPADAGPGSGAGSAGFFEGKYQAALALIDAEEIMTSNTFGIGLALDDQGQPYGGAVPVGTEW